MLNIKFDTGEKAFVIILDKPQSGIAGIMQCGICGASELLKDNTDNAIADNIESLIINHMCVKETSANREARIRK
jgi:hypothetical protein